MTHNILQLQNTYIVLHLLCHLGKVHFVCKSGGAKSKAELFKYFSKLITQNAALLIEFDKLQSIGTFVELICDCINSGLREVTNQVNEK